MALKQEPEDAVSSYYADHSMEVLPPSLSLALALTLPPSSLPPPSLLPPTILPPFLPTSLPPYLPSSPWLPLFLSLFFFFTFFISLQPRVECYTSL